MGKDSGRVTGSREPSPSSSTAGLGPSGFDPARDAWSDDLLIQRANETVEIVNEHGKLGSLTAPYAAILLRVLVWRLQTLLDAIEPFALLLGEDDEDFADDAPVTVIFGRTKNYSLTLADIRRAATAFAGGDAIATEARRAETATEIGGSVHEGAGRQASPESHSALRSASGDEG